MPKSTPPKRKYDSRRRQEQAAATRRSILEAAQRLFERDGYAATTMESIAVESGVALKTVYSAFAAKSGLLRALWDLLLKGDTDDAPVADRAWYQQMLDEKNARRKIELVARNSCIVKRRIGPLLRVIRSAAGSDPDSAALWHLIQSDFHANQRAIVNSLHQRGSLRAGLDVATATDILWMLNHPDTWLLLVGERGWTPEAFETWFATTAATQLLPTPREKRKIPR